MKPRRTPHSNQVFRLPGGNEDNDLWLERTRSDEGPCLRSVWQLTDDERAAIADGANVSLVVWGTGHPPVSLAVTDEELGRGTPPPAEV